MLEKLKEFIGSAQLTSATTAAKKKPYTGKYPDVSKIKRGYFQKGDKGAEITKLQNYLNWYTDGAFFKKCGKADGIYGPNTFKYVNEMKTKLFGKKYTNGKVGKQTLKKMKAYSDSFKPKPTPTPTPTPKPYNGSYPTEAEIKVASNAGVHNQICAWCKTIAAGGKYHYVSYSDSYYTHICPICNPRNYGLGGNCIWFSGASWHHGGGLGNRCSCDFLNDANCEQLRELAYANALALAKSKIGINDITLIRDNRGLATSLLQPGDIVLFFDRYNTYKHMAIYIGNNLISDNSGANTPNIRYGKSYNYDSDRICKVAIRYTGTKTYLSKGDQGTAVTKLQKYLDWYFDGEFSKKCGKPDGVFGPNTLKYVKKMQKKLMGEGKDTGNVGTKTLAAMKKVKK